MTIAKNNNEMCLTEAEMRLQCGDLIPEAIDLLAQQLYELRHKLSPQEWRQFATVECRQHAVMQILQQDPFIWRALNKPRGYAGDGETLDFMFAPEDGFIPPALSKCTELGR